MKIFITVLFFFCFNTFCFSQSIDEGSYMDYHGGILTADIKELNKQFDTTFHKSFNSQFVTFGISQTGWAAINRAGNSILQLSVQHILGQKMKINDTLDFRLRGGQFGMIVLGRDLFLASDGFDLLVGIGFNTGRLRLDQNVPTDKQLRFTNPFFAPKIVVQPRININNFCLSLKGEYYYDISDPDWNAKVVDRVVSPWGKTYMRGYSVQFSAGIFLK